MEFTPKSKVTSIPIDDPERLQVVVPGKHMERLKIEAIRHKTTVAEIVRTLISAYINDLDRDEIKKRARGAKNG